MGSLDKEMKAKILEYAKMSTEDFYKELNSLGLKFKTRVPLNEEVDKEKEDWYEKAWIFTTNQVLEHYKLEDIIPEEEVPLELIKKLQNEDSKGWNIISTKEETKKATEGQEKPKKTLKKKVKKLPKKVKNEKEVVIRRYKDLEELEKAYSGGELSTRDYIKLKRKLS